MKKGKYICVHWTEGSDETGDGTPENPYATRWRAYEDAQASIPVDVTVTMERGKTNWSFRECSTEVET